MKKSNLLIAAFAILAASSSAMAEGGTMGNLYGASDKISSIDMNKNYSEAGKVLDGFFSGSEVKQESDSSVVYADTGNQAAPAKTEKEFCNAQPSKTGSLVSKVPQPSSEALAHMSQKSTYAEDLETIAEYAREKAAEAEAKLEALKHKLDVPQGSGAGSIQG